MASSNQQNNLGEYRQHVMYLGPEVPEHTRLAAIELSQTRSLRNYYDRVVAQRTEELATLVVERARLAAHDDELLQAVRDGELLCGVEILIGPGWRDVDAPREE